MKPYGKPYKPTPKDELELQLKCYGMLNKTELKFHPTRKWRFDFAWPEQMLAVEVEGGIHVQGRHTTGAGFREDCYKYGEALRLGWRVLRVEDQMIKRGEAIRYIRYLLKMNYIDPTTISTAEHFEPPVASSRPPATKGASRSSQYRGKSWRNVRGPVARKA